MNTLFFWNEWKKPYKFLYLSLFLILLFTLLLYLICYFIGVDAVINWEFKSVYDSLKISVDQFSQSLFNFSVDSSTYLIREKFFASDIKITPAFAYIYFALVWIGILIALTVITRLDLVWFAIGMGLFIFFIVLQHTELLGLFGSTSQKFTLLAVLLYGGLSFYFQAYDKKFTFLLRFLSFVVLTIALAIVVQIGSQEKNPFLYMANFGLAIPVILSMIFIIAISYDIINGFLFITTSGRTIGKKALLNFSLISTLYIINLLLIYLKKKGIITGDFIYIDVFIIYIISSLIGIWALKKRASLFTSIITISDASFLYMGLAIVSTATITYSFITGNDPLKESFQYAILYSHLGMGLVFFLYILYNFWELFYKNISAYDLVYEPRRMPFFMVRPLGLVIILSLFMQSGMFPYKLVRSGYYNLVGDIYLHEGKLKEAKEAYSNGSIYGYMNHRSNYGLGTVLTKLNEPGQATEYYLKSIQKYPTEYSYVNLSNLYVDNEQFFHAFFMLKDGLAKFPESSALHNNLALLYSSKGIWDSTMIHMDLAKKYQKDDPAIASNFIWLFARNQFYQEADSVIEKEPLDNYLPFVNNQIGIYNLGNKKFEGKLNEAFLKDSLLDGRSFSYLFNYGISKLKNNDEALLKKIDYLLKYEGNVDYYFELSLLKYLSLYYSGKKSEAIKELKNLTMTASSSTSIYFNKILGLWALKQGAYLNASESFKEGITLLDVEMQFNRALALLEAGQTHEGLEIISQIKNTPQPDVRKYSQDLELIFKTTDLSEVKKWNDTLKLQLLHFRKFELPEGAYQQIHNLFPDGNLKIYSSAELMAYYLNKGTLDKAENTWKNAIEISKKQKLEKDPSTGELNFQYLKLLEQKKDWKSLKDLSGTLFLSEGKESNRSYFLAISQENTGHEKEAEANYLRALQNAPYNDKAFIKAAELYRKRNDTSKAYDILVEGLVFNKNSPELHMAYAIQSLHMNLTSYAEESLANIKELVSPQEFATFKTIFEKEKAAAENAFQQF